MSAKKLRSTGPHKYFTRGESVLAKDYNAIRDQAVDELGGTSSAMTETPKSSSAVQRFIVIAEGVDTVDCHPFDGNIVGSGIVSVAKPFTLRGGISGEYTPDDQLWAASHVLEGTGLGTDWMDLNAGRRDGAPVNTGNAWHKWMIVFSVARIPPEQAALAWFRLRRVIHSNPDADPPVVGWDGGESMRLSAKGQAAGGKDFFPPQPPPGWFSGGYGTLPIHHTYNAASDRFNPKNIPWGHEQLFRVLWNQMTWMEIEKDGQSWFAIEEEFKEPPAVGQFPAGTVRRSLDPQISIDRIDVRELQPDTVHLFPNATDNFQRHVVFSTGAPFMSEPLTPGEYVLRFELSPGRNRFGVPLDDLRVEVQGGHRMDSPVLGSALLDVPATGAQLGQWTQVEVPITIGAQS